MARLSTSSYAVLALLSQRPYSGYELTRTIHVAMSQCLPRSKSGLYNEQKLLVAQGFATATEEMNGRQKRTIYRITPAGRRALRKWFTQPAAPPVFESEAVVRLILGHVSKPENLTASLAELEGHIRDQLQTALAEMPGWIEQIGTAPDHLHDLALMARLYIDYCALLTTWSRWARDELAQRPDTWPADAAGALMKRLQDALAEAQSVLASTPSAELDGTPLKRS